MFAFGTKSCQSHYFLHFTRVRVKTAATVPSLLVFSGATVVRLRRRSLFHARDHLGRGVEAHRRRRRRPVDCREGQSARYCRVFNSSSRRCGHSSCKCRCVLLRWLICFLVMNTYVHVSCIVYLNSIFWGGWPKQAVNLNFSSKTNITRMSPPAQEKIDTM